MNRQFQLGYLLLPPLYKSLYQMHKKKRIVKMEKQIKLTNTRKSQQDKMESNSQNEIQELQQEKVQQKIAPKQEFDKNRRQNLLKMIEQMDAKMLQAQAKQIRACGFQEKVQCQKYFNIQHTQSEKQWKMDQQIIQQNAFRSYTLAKSSSPQDKINLSYCNLKDLVSLLKDQKVINTCTYNEFCINYNIFSQIVFLNSISTNKWVNLNFRSQIFTLIDHRYLTNLLVLNNSQKYFTSLHCPVLHDQKINEYLRNIYSIPYHQYAKTFYTFNQTYQRYWMPRNIEVISTTPNMKVFETQNNQTRLISQHGHFLRNKKSM